MKKVFLLFSVILLLLGSEFFPSREVEAAVVKIEKRTKDQIINKAKELTHTGLSSGYSGKMYDVNPSITAPYNAGKLNGNYIKDGVNSVNMVRYLAGLPADITATAWLGDVSQHGATLLGSINKLTHYPTKPSNMSTSFFDRGSYATARSNIAWGTNLNLAKSTMLYMSDADQYNMSTVGHRRWLLNPEMKYVGFGHANVPNKGVYTNTYVFDTSRAEKIDYNYIAWPANGDFPIQYFNHSGATPVWSITLNPSKYKTPSKSSVKVTLKRIKDGKTWSITSGSNAGYLNVDNQNYGEPNAIIFKPSGVSTYYNGDQYDVTISGIQTKIGAATTIKYRVNFFTLTGATLTNNVVKVSDMKKYDGGSNQLTYINGKGYSQFFYENTNKTYQFVPSSWLEAAGLTVEVKVVNGKKVLYINNPYLSSTPGKITEASTLPSIAVKTTAVTDMKKYDAGAGKYLTYINGKAYSQFFYENNSGNYQFVPHSWLKAAGLTVEVKQAGSTKRLYITNPYKNN